MIPPYPLRFQTIYKEKIWGGSLHADWLGAKLPPGLKIGESWEIVDRDPENSVVVNGAWAGTPLRRLIEQAPALILGPGATPARRFPLLIKFIGTGEACSLQVHPPDDYAQRRQAGESGKTEMWYVLAHKPGAEMLIGFRQAADPKTVRAAIQERRLEELVNHVRVSPGDAFFLPAGRIHGIGAGILLAEIQQNSDVTFRLYDYGRRQHERPLRDLHIDEALQVLDYQDISDGRLPAAGQPEAGGEVRPLLAHAYFNCELRRFKSELPGLRHAGFQVILVTDGRGWIRHAEGQEALARGSVYLLPAGLENWKLLAEAGTGMSVLRVWKEGG